jgi:IclR family KDG regulon transcriptional repressor
MQTNFKRVPALDKCFAILDFMARAGKPIGVNDVSRRLELNKSTVFNLLHTLADLNVLERGPDGQFQMGTRLYVLGNAAARGSGLIQTVRPFLVEISRRTHLSSFLGIRSGLKAIIVDKVDSAFDIKISSEIGMRLPLAAGAGGKALMSLLGDEEIDRVLAQTQMKRFTSKAPTVKNRFKSEILKVRKEGLAIDREEYIEGIVALAVPLDTGRDDFQAALWAVGLSRQVPEDKIPEYSRLLRETAADINSRMAAAAGSNAGALPAAVRQRYQKGEP